MEQSLKVEVKVISTETMKPSTPTPIDRKSFTLSSLDQTSPFKHFPILLFYANSTHQPIDIDININTLKTSLRETLTHFYPLAGRSDTESTISCDDQGIPFIEARVNCNLHDVLNSSRKLDVLGKLLPSFQLYMCYGQRPINEVVHLAIQVNVFLCGGVVISCYMLHKLLDGSSAGIFLNFWASLVRAKSSTPFNFRLIEPDFDATVKAFPPRALADINGRDGGGDDGDSVIASRLSYLKSIKVVGKSFVFRNEAIKKLKVKATSENQLPNPTSFEAITGFIWQHIFAAACTTVSVPYDSPTELLFTANIRSKTHPPLSKASIGNLIKSVHARVDVLGGLLDLATAIHEAVSKMKESLPASLPEKGSIADRGYKFGSYTLTSWCKLGLNEADFGFGKPNRVIPVGMVHPVLRNFVIMVDDHSDLSGDHGIEAYLFLEEKEMGILESNSQFLSFASPN